MNTNDWSEQDKKSIGDYLQGNSYLSKQYRIFYVATPKVACTSLKWWFAALEGYSKELQEIHDNRESDPDLVVHYSHQVAPSVTGLALSEIAGTLDSASYFSFAVVRNPYKRIFSAWQSKLLLREPLQVGPYVGTDFYHHLIKTPGDIATAFESFLEHLAENEAPSYWDHHWTPQASLLRPDLISYSRVIKIEEREKLTEALEDWAGPYIPDPFQGRRANESLIPYAPELITQRSAELIGALYAQDFDAFGYEKNPPGAKDTLSAEQYDTAIKAIKLIRARHQRLGERNTQIFGLNQTVAERDRQMSAFNDILAERNEQLIVLNQTLAEREGMISELSRTLTGRDAQISGLQDVLAERNMQISELRRTQTERDEQISGLKQILGDRGVQVSSLSAALTARDDELSELRQALAEYETETSRLSGTVSELSARISNLDQTLGEREGQISELKQALIERDAKIAGLINALSEQEGRVFSLGQTLNEREGQLTFQGERIQALLQSNSWKWTQPLRAISTRLAGGISPIRSAVGLGSARLPLLRNLAIRRTRVSPLFDQAFYLQQNPDVLAARIDPATHYHLSGWKEHRDPSPQFCTRLYLETHPDVTAAGISPLLHYIKHGQREGRQISGTRIEALKQPGVEGTDFNVTEGVPAQPTQGHDVDEVTERSNTTPDIVEPALDPDRVAAEIQAIRKSGLFDASYYVAMYPDIQPSPEDPIRHYCERGWREGRNPSDDFDTRGYLNAYSDIKNAGLNPFWHYVVAGASESRQATPDSNSRYEADVYFGQLDTDIKLIAYYSTPNWSATQRARKAAKGAVQALVPHDDLGSYAVSDSRTLAKQALMARRHGISAWCFAFDDAPGDASPTPLLEFLSNPEIRISFTVDIDLSSSRVDEQALACLEKALTDERCLRVDGRPVLIVTLPGNDSTYSEALEAFDTVLDHCRTFGPYCIARRDGLQGQAIPATMQSKFDAVLDFPVSPVPGETGTFAPLHKNGSRSVPYSVVVSQAVSRMGTVISEFPCYRVITLGRDDSPVSPANPLRYTRFNKGEYRRWLDAAMAEVRIKHPLGRRMLFINAWNDWNQGAVLEPDRVSGYSKLNETSRALLGLPSGIALPKISVIVPNYNHAQFLRRRLDSIYSQTYTNIEVLLLDDCSTDESRAVLSDYSLRHPEVTTTLFNDKNSGGVFRQWAKGIKAATGDLIWIAESDDYCDADFLEKLVRCFDDESVMLAYSRTEFVRHDESVMPDEFWHHVRDLDCRDKWRHSYVNTAHKEVSEALGVINTIPNASGAVFRRPIDMPLLEDETWLSMRVVGDWVFYLRQVRGGKIAYVNETTNYFRRHGDSTAANTYSKEAFYRELTTAEQTVQSLYDVPSSVATKFLANVRKYYDFHGGRSDNEFNEWCNEYEILKVRSSRTPNIVVSTMGFYPGGAEILPIRMANEFKRQGHSVVLLSAGHGQREDGVRRMLRNDIPVIETPDVETTRNLLADFGIEVLNSHQWHVQKYPVYVPDVFNSLKAHVASLHGMIEYGDAFGVTAEQLRTAHENVTTWVYTADKNLGPFIEHGLYEKGSSHFVKLPNGMEPPDIKPVSRAEIGMPDDAFVLCCVSRAIPDKGWAEAIEAVDRARNISGKDVRLILVGNGPVYDDYCRAEVPSYVYLAGFSENSVGFYAAADMGIMLTKFRSESFPLTIVDCLFAGRPYIATDVGEIRNMLSTERGLAGEVIELDDWEVPVEGAARSIATFASNNKTLEQARERVPEAANRYRIDVVARQYVEIFESTVNSNRSSGPAVQH